MFKLITTAATTTAFLAAAGIAAAQDVDPEIDVNGDGFYSYPEISAVHTELTAEEFTAMDMTGDGLLDMAEVMAAQDAGLLPVMDG